MENGMQIFENQSLGRLEAIMIDDAPWVVAKGVCTALELNDVNKAVQSLDDDEKLIRKVFVSGQNRDVIMINESGMYALILRSNKPQAKVMRKWVTSEVLPAIRKTGGYDMGTKMTPSTPAGIEAPKIEFYNNVACISAGWMIRAGIISQTYYSKLVYYGKITRTRRACNGTHALVAYDTLPEKYKARIRDRYGVLGVPTLPMNNERALAMVAEICRIEDTELRLRLLSKAIY